MPIPPRLLERIATFRAHLDSYLSPDYKEARLREEFLNPFFEALGWDIANRDGYAEAYKDVVHEDSLKISGVGTVSLRYLLGILNSRLFGWFVRGQSTVLRGGYIKFSKQYIETAPIVTTPGKKLHDAFVAHVERMLKLHEQLAAAKSPHEQTHLQRDIAATDRAIDQLVYQLYGLTPEEIALVEAATAPAAASKPADDAAAAPALPTPAAHNPQAEASAAHHHFLAKEDPPET